MKKGKFLLSILIILSMLSSLCVFADDAQGGYGVVDYSLTSENMVVSPGQTVNIDIKMGVTQFPIKKGTMTIEKSTDSILTFGDIIGQNSVTWTDSGDGKKFTYEFAAATKLDGDTVIASIPVTISPDAPLGTVKIMEILDITLATWDTSMVDTNIAINEISLIISDEAADEGARIELLAPIKDVKGISVGLVVSGKTTTTTLTLDETGTIIHITPDVELKDGTEYYVEVNGAGYTSSENTKITVDKGKISFVITDFIAGDLNGDGIVNFKDFTILCTAAASKTEVSDDTLQYDLNRDGKINDDDVATLVASWQNGGVQ